jgi:hypothetical protein
LVVEDNRDFVLINEVVALISAYPDSAIARVYKDERNGACLLVTEEVLEDNILHRLT